jgi:hypothetical protein
LAHTALDLPKVTVKHWVRTWNARYSVGFLSLSQMGGLSDSESISMTLCRSRSLAHGCPCFASISARQCALALVGIDFEKQCHIISYETIRISSVVGCGICNTYVAFNSLNSRWSPQSPVLPVSRNSPLSRRTVAHT